MAELERKVLIPLFLWEKCKQVFIFEENITMKKQTILIYLISFLIPIFTLGQSTFQENIFKKSFEFSLQVLNAQPLSISRNYPAQENDLTPNNSLSFQASFIRHASIIPN